MNIYPIFKQKKILFSHCDKFIKSCNRIYKIQKSQIKQEHEIKFIHHIHTFESETWFNDKTSFLFRRTETSDLPHALLVSFASEAVIAPNIRQRTFHFSAIILFLSISWKYLFEYIQSLQCHVLTKRCSPLPLMLLKKWLYSLAGHLINECYKILICYMTQNLNAITKVC